MSDSSIDAYVQHLFDHFKSAAEQLAAKVGCTVGRQVLDVCYRNPVFVEAKERAVERAEDLSRTVALTYVPLGAKRFELVQNGSCKGLVGLAADGTPKVCIVKGVAGVTCETGKLGYMSLAVVYALQPNGSGPAAPHKP